MSLAASVNCVRLKGLHKRFTCGKEMLAILKVPSTYEFLVKRFDNYGTLESSYVVARLLQCSYLQYGAIHILRGYAF